MEFTEKMKSLIGKVLQYNRGDVEVSGKCDEIRWSGSKIYDTTRENWRDTGVYGFEIRIKPLDGSRAFWTKSFPSDLKS